jgi:DNA transformation protein
MDREFLTDLFADFGPVTIRRMFSGFGISADGVNFALSLRAGLFFRADEQTIPHFEAEGSRPFSYQTSTRSVTVASYWQLPARLFDDTEELSEWARAALGAAQHAALKKRARKPRETRKTQGKAGAPSSAKTTKPPSKIRTGTTRISGSKTSSAAKPSAKPARRASTGKAKARAKSRRKIG